MSLVPAVDDPNRKAELKRMEQDPKAFDADPAHKHGEIKYFDAHSSGLCADRDKVVEEVAPEDGVDLDQWNDYLEQSVANITAELDQLDDEQVAALLVAETAGKNRTSLVKAINDEITSRKGE